MALNMATSNMCVPSLLTSSLENHFGIFALQTHIQNHDLLLHPEDDWFKLLLPLEQHVA